MLENEMKEDLLFRKPTDGRTTSLEETIFQRRMKQNGRTASGLCTDGEKATHKILTRFMLHRQVQTSINISEELQTVFRSVIRFFLQCQKQFFERKTAKLRDDMEAEHEAPPPYYTETR
jgi:hypothetical protein